MISLDTLFACVLTFSFLLFFNRASHASISLSFDVSSISEYLPDFQVSSSVLPFFSDLFFATHFTSPPPSPFFISVFLFLLSCASKHLLSYSGSLLSVSMIFLWTYFSRSLFLFSAALFILSFFLSSSFFSLVFPPVHFSRSCYSLGCNFYKFS